ncbi:MAG: GNAT family N-acetyltransferase [Thermoanaerobaculia bacterium]|nr:GNAT family N-acetyltransferase [Thermoanaerobaculia bacterium]
MSFSPVTAEAFADALIDDPFYQAITVDQRLPRRTPRDTLVQYFALSLEEAMRVGRCVVAEDPAQGAAAWLLPRGTEELDDDRSAKLARLSQLLGPQGYANYVQIVERMSSLTGDVVPAGAWYLSIVGVHPSAQGRGLGAKLLAPTLDEARHGGHFCYLETFSTRSVPFYEKLGFRVVGRHPEPTTQAWYSIMSTDFS